MAILTTDGSASDVQAKLTSATSGDIVTLPAGSFSWTQAVAATLPADVEILGAGTSATGGGNQTVITDNVASGSPLLQLSVAATGTFRMSGITFQSGTGAIKDGGTISVYGPGNIRIDHCRFNATSSNNYQMLKIGGGIRGVLDSSILDLSDFCAIYVFNGRSGVGESQGNYEWTQPTAFGTSDFFFIEDCIVNGSSSFGVYPSRILDGYTGAKVVVRFNTLSQACIFEQHATGHGPDDRGPRAMEAYGNLVTSSLEKDPNFTAVDLQNGTALVWGNSWGNVYKNIYRFQVVRKDNGTYNQSATPTGWGYAGSAFNGTGSNWDGGTAGGGDTVYGYPCLDQPGRGQGDLLVGTFPSKLNDATGTLHWPNQASEPIYLWNNVGGVVPGWGGGVFSNYAGESRVAANRDYYPPASGIQTSPTSPFDGTVGVGWGTLANRPTTCTEGVAYFATDQGSWNGSTSNPYGVQMNGADGVLYKATATDTWTAYYTPYTYPHPLRSTTQVSAPTFDPIAGTHEGTQTVAISCATAGATIRYTLDGSTPSASVGTIYTGEITVAATTTIKAIAYDGVLTDSDVVSAVFTIKCFAPEISPAAGAYQTEREVTLSTDTSGASIFYTVDGSSPSGSSTAYSTPFIVNESLTVKAIAIKSGLTDSSITSAAYVIGEVPDAPTTLVAGVASSSQINLTWVDTSGNELGFRIYRGTTSGALTLIHTTAPGATSYSVTGLTASTQYFFEVRAYNALGNSDPTSEVSATTLALTPAPTAPTGLTATAVSQSQINLAWTDASSNETGFKVYRGTVSGTLALVATLGPGVTSYQNTGLLSGVQYFFKVASYNATGSSLSSQATATTLTAAGPGKLKGGKHSRSGRTVESSYQSAFL